MNRAQNDDAFLAIVLVFVGVVIVIGLIIQILYLLTLSRCFSRIRPRNREMEPGLVWLNLIPCFGTAWMFVTIIKMASSLRKEYEYRGWHASDQSYGQSLGLAYNILALLGIIPYIGTVFSLASLVCFIMYWVQIAGHSKRLAEEPGYQDRNDDEEYFDRGQRYRDDDRERYRDDDDRQRDADPDARYRE